MSNWDAPGVNKWKREAKEIQQYFCDVLGDRDWDEIKANDWTTLRKKVAFGLHGEPTELPTAQNKELGYDKKHLEGIENICKKLVENLNFEYRSIHFGCAFVLGRELKEDNRFQVPVFRARNPERFVDSSARVYDSFEEFLKENELPKCFLCYPMAGFYNTIPQCQFAAKSDEVWVEYATSPACKFIRRAGNVLDTVAAVTSVGLVGVGLAALCSVPIVGPIAAASTIAGISTGAYGVARSSHSLIDRANHGQSIGLDSREARMCWLNIFGSSIGMAHGRMLSAITKAAAAGKVVGKAGQMAFIALQVGSLTVNGLGIANGLVNLVEKLEKDELKPLDVFQFTASVLFFTNSAMNMKSAETIIKTVQEDIITGHREGMSKGAEKLFKRQTRLLRGREDTIEGNAKVVKQLNNIENPKQLYEAMAGGNVKGSNGVRLHPDGFRGKVTVDGQKMNPLELLKTSTKAEGISAASNNFPAGYSKKTAEKGWVKDAETFCRENRTVILSTIQKATVTILKKFLTKISNDIGASGQESSKNVTPTQVDARIKALTPRQIDEITKALTAAQIDEIAKALQKNSNEMIIMALKFALMTPNPCSSETHGDPDLEQANEFGTRFKFFLEFFEELREKMYNMKLAEALKKPGFKLQKFVAEYGIEGKEDEWIRKQALKDFLAKGPAAYEEVEEAYSKKKESKKILQ